MTRLCPSLVAISGFLDGFPRFVYSFHSLPQFCLDRLMITTPSQETHELWARCLLNIERHVRPQSFNTWFRPTLARRFDAELLDIEVSSSYFADWVESNYLKLIQSAVKEETDLVPRIVFSIAGNNTSQLESETVSPARPDGGSTKVAAVAQGDLWDDNAEGKTEAGKPGIREKTDTSRVESPALPGEWTPGPFSTPLNERYTFDSFVIGEGNRFAHAAAYSAAKSPGKTQFNPLVIYGGVGLGKTHLLQAIGNLAQLNESNLQVAYVPSEKFMSDFIESLKTRKAGEFQRLYRSADMLLVDDIQFLLKGEHTQTEFFHTFNALHQNGKQITMTCDSPPGELQGLEERLISRFQWGLVTSIEPPDLETRIAILHKKAEINGIYLTEEVATFLGNYISTNIRELEGALNHIMAYCAVNQQELNIEAARKIVKERVSSESTHLTIEGIQRIVAEHFDLTPELLIGKTRKQEIAVPRQIAMYLAKKLTKSSLKVIGLHFGNRDHSTVIHAVRAVENKRSQDPSLSHLVESLTESIQQQHSRA